MNPSSITRVEPHPVRTRSGPTTGVHHRTPLEPPVVVPFAGGGLDLARPLQDYLRSAALTALFDLPSLQGCTESALFSGEIGTDVRLAQAVTTALWYARFTIAQEQGIVVSGVTGQSGGMWTACAAGGAIDIDTAMAAMRFRGEHVIAIPEEDRGEMVMLVGPPIEEIEAFVAGVNGVWIASYNGDRSATVSVTRAGAPAFVADVEAHGLAQVQRLPIAFASHCPLVSSVGVALRRFCAEMTVRDPLIPIFDSSSATRLDTAEQVRAALAANIEVPVLWGRTVATIGEHLGEVVYLDLLENAGMRSMLIDGGARRRAIVKLGIDAGA